MIFLKRLMDIVVSTALSIIAIPICFVTALFIKLSDGGGVFSFQKRVGPKQPRLSNLWNFEQWIFNDDGDWKEKGKVNKVTNIGKFLRKSRIDELPQLWNVFKGDISLMRSATRICWTSEALYWTNPVLQRSPHY